MDEFSTDIKGGLAKLAQERAAKRDSLQQTVEAQVPPTVPAAENTGLPVAPVETPQTSEAVLPVDGNPPVAKPEEPKPEPPLTAQVAEEAAKPWDEEVTPTTTVESKFDFKKFGSALGFEVKDEAELVQTVTDKLAKVKTLETERDSVLQGVPDNLKEALEVAKKGGDWQSLVGNMIDVSALDSKELFERDFEKRELHKYKLADGSIDYDKMYADIDAIPEALRVYTGDSIKQQISNVQNQRKMEILQKAQAQQYEFNRKLADATREISKILPKETFGVTFEAKHSEFLYAGITNQTLIKKHFGDVEPAALAKIDPAKLTKAVALLEYADKIAKYQYSQGQVNAKKELLAKTQNVQISTGGLPAAPEQTESEKPKTSTQKLIEHRDRHIKQGSL